MLNLRNNSLSGSIPDPVGVPNVRILSGPISEQLCELKGIGMMDLSNNSFSGSIPSCFKNITFGMSVFPVFGNRRNGIGGTDTDKDLDTDTISYNYGNYLQNKDVSYFSSVVELLFDIDFTTKYLLLSYKGGILDFMSGLDLSNNNLTGRIPWSIGD
ncbi:hypothetical protein REPUB_Repub13aG0153600 [Reevesia pubescens]